MGGEGARGNLILYEGEKTIEKVDCKLFGKGIIRSVFRQIDSISIFFFFQRSIVGDCPIDGFGSRCVRFYPAVQERLSAGDEAWRIDIDRAGSERDRSRTPEASLQLLISLENLSFVPDHPVSDQDPSETRMDRSISALAIVITN